MTECTVTIIYYSGELPVHTDRLKQPNAVTAQANLRKIQMDILDQNADMVSIPAHGDHAGYGPVLVDAKAVDHDGNVLRHLTFHKLAHGY